MTAPVVVVGSGISGLAAAWAVSPQPVLLLTAAGVTQQAASSWAQGGIAAALGPNDSAALHAQDTRLAGAGVGDDETIARITDAATNVVADLETNSIGGDPLGE